MASLTNPSIIKRLGGAHSRSDRDRLGEPGAGACGSSKKEYARKVGKIIAASLTFIFGFAAATAYGQAQAMQVEVTSVPQMIRNGERFLLTAGIRNLSDEEQSLQVWSCSFPKN